MPMKLNWSARDVVFINERRQVANFKDLRRPYIICNDVVNSCTQLHHLQRRCDLLHTIRVR